MNTVRTIRYTRKELVEVIDVPPLADPGHGEVQVQSLACGVCAWDLHVYRNGADWPVPPGHEGLGRVVKVGPGVGHVKEGDVVTGSGMGFTEVYNRSAWGLYVLPQRAADEPHLWVVEPVSCAVTGIEHCKTRPGDRVAVVGCGFMGQMIVQGLGRSLLDRLICIDIDAKRLEMARQFGATDTIDARNADAGALKAMGIDCVVDCSGNQAGLNLSSRIVRDGGRLNLFGWNHGTGEFPGDIWHMGGITVVNSAPNSAERDPWPAAIRLLDRGLIDLRPLVSHVVALEEYPALLAYAASRPGDYIKGVVRHDLKATARTAA